MPSTVHRHSTEISLSNSKDQRGWKVPMQIVSETVPDNKRLGLSFEQVLIFLPIFHNSGAVQRRHRLNCYGEGPIPQILPSMCSKIHTQEIYLLMIVIRAIL